jgi:alpha-L-fucosidase 2
MKTTRREFLQTSALASLASVQPLSNASPTGTADKMSEHHPLDAFEIAGRHLLARKTPGPTYFEGLLLGNGDVGVCAVVRPDALGLHISKTDCWDIRVSEGSEKEIIPFADILGLWKEANEEAKRHGSGDGSVESTETFRRYAAKVGTTYGKPWPRPWSCGTVWIKWDPRWTEPGAFDLNPANGLFTLELNSKDLHGTKQTSRLKAFVDWDSGILSVHTDAAIPSVLAIYSPHIDGFHAGPFDSGHVDAKPDLLPAPELNHSVSDSSGEFSCLQQFPAIGPTEEHPVPPKSDKDRNFALYAKIAGAWNVTQQGADKDLVFSPKELGPLRLAVMVATPRDLLLRRLERESPESVRPSSWLSIPQTHVFGENDLETLSFAKKEVTTVWHLSFADLQNRSETRWRQHWSNSAMSFEDETLERVWYHNQYFLACCLRKHRTAPGLFANWSSEDIGSAWHSDYHLDYNCQQVYWGVFSSNHIDMHQPYLELIENLVPMSEKFARESFRMPGAFFPLSAFPVPSQIVPYPVPPWGYQICMTPWAVQSLWWQFLYTQDEDFLRRIYPIMRAALDFLAAYLTREDDGFYHVFPSVSSENWGFTIDFKLNKDCILDLALTRFLLDAMVTASGILSLDQAECIRWKDIREHLAPYPKATGPYGEVWLDISNAPVEHVYNVPITLAPVFPGEQVGIGKGQEFFDIATRTAQTIRLEGGNDLVSQPLIRARLGILDLEWFKGQIEYCMLPDGVSNDRVRQSGGRYGLSTDFDFMMRMGLWCENFTVSLVLNECVLQSYTGIVRLFPNTTNLGPARFANLRAVGAFLVSATHDGTSVTNLTVLSEKGKIMQLATPWPKAMIRVTRMRDGQIVPTSKNDQIFSIPTDAGERYVITPQA